MALTVTAAGGLALFAGVLVLGHIAGGYDLDLVLASGDRVRAHPLYPAALALVANYYLFEGGQGWSSRAPSPSPRSSRSTSGCRTLWRRRRPSRPTCTPPRW